MLWPLTVSALELTLWLQKTQQEYDLLKIFYVTKTKPYAIAYDQCLEQNWTQALPCVKTNTASFS